MRGVFIAVLVDRAHGAAGQNGDAGLFHFGADMRPDVVVKTAQHVLAAIDQRHVAAEPGEDAGELQRDIAAALDHDALRLLRQVKHLVGRNHVLDAGNGGAMVRRAAGGDQHGAGAHRLARAQPQRVRVFKHRARPDDLGAGLFDIGRIDRLEPGDLAILIGNQRRPIERRLRDAPAEAGGILQFVVYVRGVHHQLLGHAAANHAGAAEPILFCDHHPGAMARSDARGAHTARTAADYEQIDIEIGHSALAPVCVPRSGIRFPCRACASQRGICR